MYKKLFFILPILVATSFAVVLFPRSASAYNRGDIMSNAVYSNSNSMTKDQIQAFLVSKKSALATYKDQGPNESKKELASYLIWHAGQIWGINPQLILGTLQKEQSLITKQNPTAVDYRSAMGYGCPDGADCNASYYGFANQVNMASYQFRYNYEALLGHSSFKDVDGDSHPVGQFACAQADGDHNPPFYNKALTPGNKVTFAAASKSYSSSTVTIANEATASLLCYTPHVGPASTTGYPGSDNLVTNFVQWFGSTHYVLGGAIGDKYTATGGEDGPLGQAQSNEVRLSTGVVYQQFEGGRIYWKSTKGAWVVAGGVGSKYVGSKEISDYLGAPLNDEVHLSTGGVYQQFENGRIYWKSKKGTWVAAGAVGSKYIALGADNSALGYPLSDETPSTNGGVYQQFEGGRIYWNSRVGAWSVTDSVLNYYTTNGASENKYIGYPTSDITTLESGEKYQLFENASIHDISGTIHMVQGGINDRYIASNGISGRLGAPTADETKLSSGGVYQQFENGRIYWKSRVGAWIVMGDILNKYISMNADTSTFGYPTADLKETSPYGMYQNFQNGTIYKTDSGTYTTQYAIGEKYKSVNGVSSILGYPQGNEIRLSNGIVYQQFEGGRIYWKSTKGAWVVAGGIGSKYVSSKTISDYLGAPLNDEVRLSTGGVYQQFENGRIYWKSKKGTWVVAGAVGSKYIAQGADNSALGYPLSDEVPSANGGVYQQFEGGRIYWNSGVGATVDYN